MDNPFKTIDKSLWIKIFWWSTIIISVASFSLILSHQHYVTNLINEIGVGILLLEIGIFIGAVATNCINGAGAGPNNVFTLDIALEAIITKKFWKHSLAVIVFMAMLTLLVICIAAEKLAPETEKSKFLLQYFTESPGGLFGILAGTFTMVGTFLAYQSITEMKHTITSYPQLLEHIIELIKKADDHERILIVSYFGLPGYWQVPSERLRNLFENEINNLRKKIKIICLNAEEHMKMLLTIAILRKEKDKTAGDVIGFHEKSMKILTVRSKTDKSFCKTLHWDSMPPYYFFVTDHRAIIVTPVGLPSPYESFNDLAQKAAQIIQAVIEDDLARNGPEMKNLKIQIENALKGSINNSDRGGQGHVHTYGFETNDRSIIADLQNTFARLYDNKNAEEFQTLNSDLLNEDSQNSQ